VCEEGDPLHICSFAVLLGVTSEVKGVPKFPAQWANIGREQGAQKVGRSDWGSSHPFPFAISIQPANPYPCPSVSCVPIPSSSPANLGKKSCSVREAHGENGSGVLPRLEVRDPEGDASRGHCNDRLCTIVFPVDNTKNHDRKGRSYQNPEPHTHMSQGSPLPAVGLEIVRGKERGLPW